MPKVFNNQVFIDFLAQLRPDEQHQYNSPWNIAAEDIKALSMYKGKW